MTTPEREERYWFNSDRGVIHRHSCLHCRVDYDGRERSGWEGESRESRSNWWGPYRTIGAAIDVGLSTGHSVRLCRHGCGDWPQINPSE